MSRNWSREGSPTLDSQLNKLARKRLLVFGNHLYLIELNSNQGRLKIRPLQRNQSYWRTIPIRAQVTRHDYFINFWIKNLSQTWLTFLCLCTTTHTFTFFLCCNNAQCQLCMRGIQAHPTRTLARVYPSMPITERWEVWLKGKRIRIKLTHFFCKAIPPSPNL